MKSFQLLLKQPVNTFKAGVFIIPLSLWKWTVRGWRKADSKNPRGVPLILCWRRQGPDINSSHISSGVRQTLRSGVGSWQLRRDWKTAGADQSEKTWMRRRRWRWKDKHESLSWVWRLAAKVAHLFLLQHSYSQLFISFFKPIKSTNIGFGILSSSNVSFSANVRVLNYTHIMLC